MNKLLPVIVVGVVVVGGGGAAAYFLTRPNQNPSSNNNPISTTNPNPANNAQVTYENKDACTIFTLDDAKKVLGDSAKAGTGTPGATSNDISVSTCSYLVDTNTPGSAPVSVKNIHSASILVRAPKSATGTTSNKQVFTALPAGAQSVSGYGDSAFWNPTLGQLNVLKGNVWVILSSGVSSPPSGRTLDDAKKLADIIIPKL